MNAFFVQSRFCFFAFPIKHRKEGVEVGCLYSEARPYLAIPLLYYKFSPFQLFRKYGIEVLNVVGKSATKDERIYDVTYTVVDNRLKVVTGKGRDNDGD